MSMLIILPLRSTGLGAMLNGYQNEYVNGYAVTQQKSKNEYYSSVA